MTEQPRSKFRLAGEDVVFCCSAVSSPNITYYEWFVLHFHNNHKKLFHCSDSPSTDCKDKYLWHISLSVLCLSACLSVCFRSIMLLAAENLKNRLSYGLEILLLCNGHLSKVFIWCCRYYKRGLISPNSCSSKSRDSLQPVSTTTEDTDNSPNKGSNLIELWLISQSVLVWLSDFKAYVLCRSLRQDRTKRNPSIYSGSCSR